MYGLNGELFRGITTQVELNTGGANSGTFSAFESVSWTGGTGQMLAIDDTTASASTNMWIQVLTGTAPGDAVLITGGTSGATATTDTPGTTDREALLTFPFLGASTGSSLIGGYGVGVDSGDLTASDILFELTSNTQIVPPNNVTVSIGGLVTGEDYVTVTQRGWRFAYDGESGGTFAVGDTITFTVNNTGTATIAEIIDQGTTGYIICSELSSAEQPADDSQIQVGGGVLAFVNGSSASDIDKRQYTIATTALSGGSITSVEVTPAIDSDTPSSGVVRVQDDAGYYRRLVYTSYTGSTFTIDDVATEAYDATTAADADFSVTGGAIGNNVYIGYLDELAVTVTESFTSVYSADRNLFVRVRDGGGTPIKTFETTVTMGSSGGSATAIRTSDE